MNAKRQHALVVGWKALAFLILMIGISRTAAAQNGSLDIYGFAMVDTIVDFKQVNPDWYDTVRPSKLPAFENQFGEDGHYYMSVRQTRFGVKGEMPTASGPIKAQFEFEMFGVGPDAGQTTIRLRHAWGQWKQFGAGQTNSVFVDADIFPNTVEYWGPNGFGFFRNIQVFWRPIERTDGTRATFAIENPGASGDAGVYADRVELQGVTARFPMPDFTGEYRLGRKWGYVEAAGVVGKTSFDDLNNDQFNLDDTTTRWGLNFTSQVKPTKNDTVKLGYIFGDGIANYFNDAPTDIAAKSNADPTRPIRAEALPIQGFLAYLDHNWNSKYSTSVGYSRVDYDTTDAQTASAYKSGQYFSVNLLTTPAPNVMMGGELIWGNRENNTDGFTSDDVRVQFTFKYSFGTKIGG